MKWENILKFMAKALICSGTMLMLTTLFSAPVMSSPDMSKELRELIVGRIQVPGERDLVLQSVSEAAVSGYPEDRLIPVIEKTLDAGVSGAGLSRMVDILIEAHEKGLPTRTYSLKIMEGLIKKVSEDQLIMALESVDERLEFAAGLVGGAGLTDRGSQDLILRTADAVAAGMDKEVLSEVYDTMARERVNRKITPEQIMGMVKAARGYGLDSKKVGAFAISLMVSPDADEGKIRKFLKELSEQAYAGGSDRDLEDVMEEHLESAGDRDDGDDYGKGDDGSDDEVSGDDGSSDDSSESDGTEKGDSEEKD